MKKQLIIAALAIATTLSGFAQGFVLFSSTKAAGVFYAPSTNPTNSGSQLGNGGITVGFLWANTGTGNPLIGATGSPTASTVAADWSLILNDSNFHFASNSVTGSLVTQSVNNSGVQQGGWGYNSGQSFGLLGSAPGSTINAFVVAWSSAYANPFAAAAAGSFLGWSQTIPYATGPLSSSGVSTFAASGQTSFGVQPVPEPATFAFAGLGVAAMLIARRRK